MGDMVTKLACIEFLVADSLMMNFVYLSNVCLSFFTFGEKWDLVVCVELACLLAGLVYHIVVDIRVIS